MPAEQIIERKESPKAAHSSVAKTDLSVTGMTCGNCARHVTEALQSVAGVHSANVSLDSQRASVRWTPGSAQNPAGLVQAVEQAGYEAKLVEVGQPASDVGARKLAG